MMVIRLSNMRLYVLFSLALFLVISGNVIAQDKPAEPLLIQADDADKGVSTPYSTKSMANKIPSLFFTYWQHKTIQDAKNSRGAVRPPSDSELDLDSDEYKPDPGPREIKLDGILFNAENNWTIWLNGQRISPDAIPKEVMDLRVYNDYVELKWLDEFSNRVFPLRLRVHQRFNLDMRIFLPG